MPIVPKTKTVQKIRVRVTNNNGSLLQSSSSKPNVVVKSTAVVDSSSYGRLDTLRDVRESDPLEGDTLVYQANTDSYVVKSVDIDGGTF